MLLLQHEKTNGRLRLKQLVKSGIFLVPIESKNGAEWAERDFFSSLAKFMGHSNF
jgi:hypothetical protein